MINFLIYIFILFFSSLNGMTNFDSAEAKAILQQVVDLIVGENRFDGQLRLANVDGNIAGFSYQSKDGEIKNITLNDNNKNDFNEIMSVIIHEGGGHSFQDNVLVNNNDRIMKDSFYNSSPTGYKFGNNELDYSIYRLDPAERDAWKFQYGVMKGIGE